MNICLQSLEITCEMSSLLTTYGILIFLRSTDEYLSSIVGNHMRDVVSSDDIWNSDIPTIER
jgi:hypothetical protein